ncbi:MAG: hybrid sensor histidine kinase/response regulator [Bacteroidales bacterium]|nr:hybrid sensor histidine kinase/response regulator [Bacteroidales bacterium]
MMNKLFLNIVLLVSIFIPKTILFLHQLQIKIWDKTLLLWIFLFFSFALLAFFFLNRRKQFNHKISDKISEKNSLSEKIEQLKSNKNIIASDRKNEIKKQLIEIETNIKGLKSALKDAKEGAVRNSELLSNISYTLRTNLNDIMGFSNLLENEFARQEEKELYDFSKNIRSSGQSLLHLLNNMIDISRIEAGDFIIAPKNCKISTVISDLIKIFEPEATRKGLKISFEPVTVPRFSTDIEAIKHILSNLLDNAVKFTDKGFIKISCDKEADKVLISIKDTGVGIDKAFISEIFDPFSQTLPGFSKSSYKGTGLGLPLVKQMVDLLNGQISMHSEKMAGTTVTLSFPQSQPVLEATNKEIKPSAKEGEITKVPSLKKSIAKMLIIDGDPFNKLLIKKMIPSVELITQVPNENDLREILTKDGTWDVILLDIDFQKIDYGIGLVNKYRVLFKSLEHVPFIALQSVPDETKEQQCLNEGFASVLEKPISKERLINILNKSL